MNKNPTDATVCRYLFTAKLLYMFRVSQHTSSGVLKIIPAASGIIFNTPDDVCCDTRNMYSSFAVNKYLHTVASVGFLLTFDECMQTLFEKPQRKETTRKIFVLTRERERERERESNI